MPIAYWCILIAALLPITLVSFAKAGASGDNRHPRENLEGLPDAKRRAYAAHENAYENFPFFAAAVISAAMLGAPIGIIIAIRIAHGIFYINDNSSPRSMAYLAGLLVNIAIFVLPAFK